MGHGRFCAFIDARKLLLLDHYLSAIVCVTFWPSSQLFILAWNERADGACFGWWEAGHFPSWGLQPQKIYLWQGRQGLVLCWL